ncbi:MAG TPA: ATP-binding cassette domain-containing protein [Candidatus Krumholzibacteria bacterium]|jgi:ABC-2 type transport system ATP-binding protein|nr:ATP-binding cassette domain-containing protein [Candidatus Krumholzibacteria bacterium]
MQPAVEIHDIVKRYGDYTAVDHVSLNVPAGTIYGFLGPNGAGKTSTIRMMMRILLPDEGSIRILDKDLATVNLDRIGYLPEERGLYKKMRLLDQMVFFGEIRGLPRSEARNRAGAWLERMGLADRAMQPVEGLSKGMQQKVQFIATVLHEPDLLILDEPFSGLDPVNANVLKDIILEYHRKGHTIIFSTHQMDTVEKLCDHICLINKGRVLLEGTLASVKQRYGKNGVSLSFTGDGTYLHSLPEVASYQDNGNEVFLRLKDGVDPGRVLDAARARLSVTRFELAEPSVYDIFIEQVSGDVR